MRSTAIFKKILVDENSAGLYGWIMITEQSRRDRQKSVLASLRSRTVEVSTAEDALARQRKSTAGYIDTVTTQLATERTLSAEQGVEINRLNRCLRVIRNLTRDIPAINLQVQRAIDGERL